MGLKITKQFELNKSRALECAFKMARQSNKEKNDVIGIPCKLMVTREEEVKVWKEYEEKLLNEENDWNRELKMENVQGLCERVLVEDMLEAVKLMNTGKTAGLSGITVDMLKVCEKKNILKLTKVANDMLNRKKMLKSRKKGDLIPVYKRKGDV